jgi:hypothetical protein
MPPREDTRMSGDSNRLIAVVAVGLPLLVCAMPALAVDWERYANPRFGTSAEISGRWIHAESGARKRRRARLDLDRRQGANPRVRIVRPR